MIKTKYPGIHHTIGHRTAFLKICDFLPGTAILLKETVNLENFPSSPSCQIFKLGEARINKQHPGG
jgi:hypothetical protein